MTKNFLIAVSWYNGSDRFTEHYIFEAADYDHAQWLAEQFVKDKPHNSFEGNVTASMPIDPQHENIVSLIEREIGYTDFTPSEVYDCGGDSLDGVCDKCVICMDEGTVDYIHEGVVAGIMEKCAHCEELRE